MTRRRRCYGLAGAERHLAEALSERGFTVSHKLVGRLLAGLGFSLQANHKTREEAIIRTAMPSSSTSMPGSRSFQAKKQPAISVDTKKKELVGDFKNAGGRELRPKGDPEPVRVHRLQDPGTWQGSALYGVYDIAANAGWVSVGIDHDTGSFRRREHPALVARTRPVRAIRGQSELLITADCGGSNGARVRLWKWELQKLAKAIGVAITVAHLPPGTSKWNRIEHRLFAFITQNWRGKPLVSHQVIVQLIGATTTKTGLSVACRIDDSLYPKGVTVSDDADRGHQSGVGKCATNSTANGIIRSRRHSTPDEIATDDVVISTQALSAHMRRGEALPAAPRGYGWLLEQETGEEG